MVSVELTNDLKNGLSLEEALLKHNTSLREIFKDVNNYPVKRENRTPRTSEWKYIQYTQSHTYRIIKGKHRICYGTYKTFEDAKKVREELIKCNWDKKQLDNILSRNNIRSQRKNKANRRIKWPEK